MYLWLRKKLLKSLGSADEIEIAELKEKEKGLICFEGWEDLRLDCLLKASAEVLGKGFSGSAYKAALEDGIIVAVKRLSAVHFSAAQGGKVFDRQIRIIGRVRHPNVVSLEAFCDAHEEKLLVYNYMHKPRCRETNARLSHPEEDSGDRRRRTCVHPQVSDEVPASARQPEAVKHSDRRAGQRGCVSEWGIMRFAANIRCSPGDPSGCSSDRGTFTAVAPASQRYLAPELASGKEQATQESDVYSFCMMIQKVATDKEMEDGELQEEEISEMVKIALLCTAGRPEKRPEMSQVVRMMGEFL
ncbi:probable leucine-rich repeat receptor-like protein kinase At1g68400 [Zingiber officinale]|uniref:probable leucine-rich repeat receptor-like protein kinase At1g68400 n=1 Tax=Zingiber officinale TaxID=94328 RepID=UPI001C4D926D|nr:probable leucine-rich repeat receptor-like protein kinase At1g68400 [Zingiber officinale]